MSIYMCGGRVFTCMGGDGGVECLPAWVGEGGGVIACVGGGGMRGGVIACMGGGGGWSDCLYGWGRGVE